MAEIRTIAARPQMHANLIVPFIFCHLCRYSAAVALTEISDNNANEVGGL